jgi:hypothetical protein
MIDEVEEGEPERVAKGRADEGERIPTIVEQMKRGDEETILVEMEGDDSDKEEGDA